MSKWDTTKSILKWSSPLPWLVIETAEKAVNAMSKASDKGIKELEEEVAKQTLQMQMAQHQARIAQELAIAKRIENAEEVEIEEFYDTSGKGNLGFSIDQASQSATIGMGGEGRRVTKRIYHFKGWREQGSSDLEESTAETESIM